LRRYGVDHPARKFNTALRAMAHGSFDPASKWGESAIIVYGKRDVTDTSIPRFLLPFVNHAIRGRKFFGNPDKSRENIRHSL
jgi:hypothetical protein